MDVEGYCLEVFGGGEVDCGGGVVGIAPHRRHTNLIRKSKCQIIQQAILRRPHILQPMTFHHFRAELFSWDPAQVLEHRVGVDADAGGFVEAPGAAELEHQGEGGEGGKFRTN